MLALCPILIAGCKSEQLSVSHGEALKIFRAEFDEVGVVMLPRSPKALIFNVDTDLGLADSLRVTTAACKVFLLDGLSEVDSIAVVGWKRRDNRPPVPEGMIVTRAAHSSCLGSPEAPSKDF